MNTKSKIALGVVEAQEWRNSAAFKELSPQRDKALKVIRVYAKEGAAN